VSQATDLISEVEQSLKKVKAGLKRFEGEFGEVGQFTDLAHLNVAAIHLRELSGSLESQAAAPVPEPEPEPQAQTGPTWSQGAGVRPLSDADLKSEPVTAAGEEGQVPVPAVDSPVDAPPAEPAADPVDALVAVPEKPAGSGQ
jgi:hypothetical protein